MVRTSSSIARFTSPSICGRLSSTAGTSFSASSKSYELSMSMTTRAVRGMGTYPTRRGSVRCHAVLLEVLQVERAQQIGDLALPGVGDVVDVGADLHDVRVGLVELPGRRLGRRQVLHQLPEELDVEVAARAVNGQVVEL